MKDLRIQFKNLRPGAPVPLPATDGSAGYDLYNPSGEEYIIPPNENILIPTGWACAIPKGFAGFICPRSGLALKRKVTVGNSPGIIDSDYRKEIGVIIHNHSSSSFVITGYDRIAQLLIVLVYSFEMDIVDDLDSTSRDGGFGSTGR